MRYHAAVPDPSLKPIHMRKLLIFGILLASLAGCGSVDRIPFVHRIDVQQGNVLTQEAVDQLRPGMTRRQVKFVMGTPLLMDPFHDNRWDYLYRMQPGRGEVEQKRVTLFFDGDRLVEIRGDLRPRPDAATDTAPKIATVTVPPQPRKPRGLLTRLWNWMGFGSEFDDLGVDGERRRQPASAPHAH